MNAALSALHVCNVGTSGHRSLLLCLIFKQSHSSLFYVGSTLALPSRNH